MRGCGTGGGRGRAWRCEAQRRGAGGCQQSRQPTLSPARMRGRPMRRARHLGSPEPPAHRRLVGRGAERRARGGRARARAKTQRRRKGAAAAAIFARAASLDFLASTAICLSLVCGSTPLALSSHCSACLATSHPSSTGPGGPLLHARPAAPMSALVLPGDRLPLSSAAHVKLGPGLVHASASASAASSSASTATVLHITRTGLLARTQAGKGAQGRWVETNARRVSLRAPLALDA